MSAKMLIAISAMVFAASGAIAGGQPPAHSGHFKPVISVTPPPGPDGTLGMAILSAVVANDGTVVRGAGVTGASSLSTGDYEVDFNRDVSACTYPASIGDTGAGVARGLIDVATRAGNPSGVFVQTFDLTGAAANEPFQVLIFCTK